LIYVNGAGLAQHNVLLLPVLVSSLKSRADLVASA
jgi:hypothetical protein